VRRAIEAVKRGSWPAERAADSVTLDYDARHRRRIRLVSDGGTDFLLDLPAAAVLGQGDGLRLEDGHWLRVVAAPEDLLEVRCDSPAALARVAWHLGNRHLPAELGPDWIRLRPDHVIAAMLAGLGAQLALVQAPFEPERGAYAQDPHGH
jgi:urease accessory protein